MRFERGDRCSDDETAHNQNRKEWGKKQKQETHWRQKSRERMKERVECEEKEMANENCVNLKIPKKASASERGKAKQNEKSMRK